MTAPTTYRVLPFESPNAERERARLLLRDLRSEDRERALAAERRFRVLPGWEKLPPGRLLGWRDDLRLRHALAVIRAESRREDKPGGRLFQR
jgi:hypothetical protein